MENDQFVRAKMEEDAAVAEKRFSTEILASSIPPDENAAAAVEKGLSAELDCSDPLSSYTTKPIPPGVSGTALAVTLLKEGWNVIKMYEKYQIAAHDLSNSQLERKQCEDTLAHVLHELEEKVTVIEQEREEHKKLVEQLELYVALDQKLTQTLIEDCTLKAKLKRQERDYAVAQKDILVLKQQVAVLSKKGQETTRQYQQALEQLRSLEEDLTKSQSEIISLRFDRDKKALQATFSDARNARLLKDFDQQREKKDEISARNVELSALLVDHQKKFQGIAVDLDAANYLSKKLSMEVAILKQVNETLLNNEERAADSLQATLASMRNTEAMHKETRDIVRRYQKDYLNDIERKWDEAKRELQEQQRFVRELCLDHESTLKDARKKVDELNKELSNALQSVAKAESRAAFAEARISDLENIMESSKMKDSDGVDGGLSSCLEKMQAKYQMQIKILNEEVHASVNHMFMYKRIAEINEAALSPLLLEHENLEQELIDWKRKALTKEKAHDCVLTETAILRDNYSAEIVQTEKLAKRLGERETILESLRTEIEHLKAEKSDLSTNLNKAVQAVSEQLDKMMQQEAMIRSLQEVAANTDKIQSIIVDHCDNLKQENRNFKKELGSTPSREPGQDIDYGSD